ncbi:MAG: CPBP family intramembrane metalloprotease [Ruminococcus sp.]|nr:CPBP family intramembrane metalloprotease [Ruminococcus sp.]
MLRFKPKMFQEASASYVNHSIPVKILIFIAAFVVILILESIIPSVLTLPEIMDELASDPLYTSGKKQLTLAESMDIASKYTHEPKIMIPNLLCTVFGTIVSLFCCRCIEMRHVRSMGVRKRRLVPHYLTGLGIGAVLMTSITLLTVISGANSISLCSGINFGIIALYLLGFFVQGMSEEFIFRGYLMSSLGSKNTTIAVIVNSAAFGLAHGLNPGLTPLAMVNLVLFGLFASFYVILFDDLWGACAIHSVWNFMQGNIYGISVSGSGKSESVFAVSQKSSHGFLTGGDFGIEGSIFTTIILLIATAAVLYAIKRSYPDEKKITQTK